MANSKQKNLLVTTALPYGNGALHIGHLLEHTQTDVWVRTNKMEGNNVLNFCADDAHGAPIMIKAKEEGQDPEEFTKGIQIEHLKTLKSFGIEHDHYHSTHSVENEQLVNEIYNDLLRADLVYEKEILQLFDDQEKMFLADRYIKGTCPSCGAEDQYGDGCEVCGITYDAIDIKNPISALSGTEPSKKKTNQIFFNLNKCKDFLSGYLDELSIQESVKNKLLEWLGGDLQDWNISRDKPYFGFKIPQHDDKYFYVWVDAPIGYIAATKHYCDENKIDYLNLWGKDSNYEIHHFIGKDIIYFHGLFWPAMLNASKYKLPSSIHAHGFLSLNGEKMSKSKGTLISADKFAEVYEPDLLRFYFASKLNAKIDDIDLDLKDFVKKINSSLVGKLFNIASRLDSFLSKNSYQTSKNIDHAFLDECSSEYELIRKDLNNKDFSKAVSRILKVADDTNSYINNKTPWKLNDDDALEVATTGISIYKDLCILILPIMPSLASKALAQVKIENPSFDDLNNELTNVEINAYNPLLNRLEDKDLLTPSKEMKMTEIDNNEITIDDFAKIDLRVAEVIEANHIDGADKLIQLTLDVGELGQRNVFAGIKSKYSPEDLQGKFVALVANLKPRKMKFGTSEGMVLAASNDEGGIFIMSPASGAKAGDKIK